MKKAQVQVGATYSAKVAGWLTEVKIVRESPYGGWYGVKLTTGREVRVKTAARLRFALTWRHVDEKGVVSFRDAHHKLPLRGRRILVDPRATVLVPGECPSIVAGPSESELALEAQPEIHEHDFQEQPGEPPVDVCNSCGKVAR